MKDAHTFCFFQKLFFPSKYKNYFSNRVIFKYNLKKNSIYDELNNLNFVTKDYPVRNFVHPSKGIILWSLFYRNPKSEKESDNPKETSKKVKVTHRTVHSTVELNDQSSLSALFQRPDHVFSASCLPSTRQMMPWPLLLCTKGSIDFFFLNHLSQKKWYFRWIKGLLIDVPDIQLVHDMLRIEWFME